MYIIFGILIPFLGTFLGAAMVFTMKNTLNNWIEKFLLGLASGVMIAASIWSLLIPSVEMAKNQGIIDFLPGVVGFSIGIAFLIFIDMIIFNVEKNLDINNDKNTVKNNLMLFLSVTLHNVPEGMAIGVVLAGIISKDPLVTIASVISLAIGIGIQNFPEGAIISMPLKASGMSKKSSFFLGIVSGIVEAIAAIITIIFTSKVIYILPYILSFAAGCMFYVVIKELVPKSQEGKNANIGIIGLTIGFLLMMVLDVML